MCHIIVNFFPVYDFVDYTMVVWINHKYPNSKEIVSTGSTENCETEKKNTEVDNDKKYLQTM